MRIPFSFEPQFVKRISEQMNEGFVGLILIDTEKSAFTLKYGEQMADRVLDVTKAKLIDTVRSLSDFFMIGDDLFAFVHVSSLDYMESLNELHEYKEKLKWKVQDHFQRHDDRHPRIELKIGCALTGDWNGESVEEKIFRAMKYAIWQAGKTGKPPESAELYEEYHTILERGLITSVYQPIISLSDAAVFGYEALTRGPQFSLFHSPSQLFEFAEEYGNIYVLDRLARKKAIENCHGLKNDQRVFINIPAYVIHDPKFTPGQTMELLMQYELHPHNVVFEITERSSLEDFAAAQKVLQHYRNQGYQLAIDDTGAGYSSLQSIAELQPDFIKVDRSLIRNIHRNKIKENILETIIAFSQKMNIRLIAEGIETLDELVKLTQMGVHFAQGFFLGKPERELQPLNDEVADHILRLQRMCRLESSWTIGHLAYPIKQFEEDTLISELYTYFKHFEHELGAVIVRGEQPVGLMMRENLFRELSGQYGISLYWNRPIRQIMDRHPLIVDNNMPVEQVSQMAMSRDINKLYDFVIVMNEKKMEGVTTVRSILECITQERMEKARVANPLTGLPGNIQIQKELNKRLSAGKPFSVIYADLDYFKWFNDCYGFQKGDEMIQITADILQYSCTVCGDPYDFVGHIGGDDFIVITNSLESKRLCEEIIRRFDLGTQIFYDDSGDCCVVDRQGNPVQVDRVTLSLSLIVCEPSNLTAEQISNRAAYMKKIAKSQIGSVYSYEVIGDHSRCE